MDTASTQNVLQNAMHQLQTLQKSQKKVPHVDKTQIHNFDPEIDLLFSLVSPGKNLYNTPTIYICETIPT